jgi:glycosyltransferase involved in cell wall biosynthesis
LKSNSQNRTITPRTYMLELLKGSKSSTPGQRGKVIGIHHRLTSLSGHRYNEAAGSIEEYGRRGRKVLLFISRLASPEIAQKLGASAVLDDPTFCLEWSFAERTRLFAEMLHTHIAPVVEAEDRVFLTVATQLEANALTRWLRELPAQKKPWIVTVFLSDRWNRSGPAEYARQVVEFHTLREELKKLSAAENQKLLFFSVTESLSDEIGQLTEREVGLVPLGLRYELSGKNEENIQESGSNSTPLIAVLGGMRPEKGSVLIPEIFRACQEVVKVRFKIQMVNEGLSPEDFASILALADEPTVAAIPRELQIEEYADAMKSADLALFPYEVIPYRQRTSAVFAEAVAYGKPAVVPEGTWLARQIEEGRAAGIVCDDLCPAGYARGIAECVANLPKLTTEARARSTEWRESVNMSRFIDIVEQEIERRALPLLD